MVEVIQGGQVSAYADFDNRAASPNPQRVALADLAIIDLSPFLGESTAEERMRTARHSLRLSAGLQRRPTSTQFGRRLDRRAAERRYLRRQCRNLLARWTNDLYTSTLHRALHIGNEPRISGALFVYPDANAPVRCLDTCQGPDNSPRYEQVVTDDYVRGPP